MSPQLAELIKAGEVRVEVRNFPLNATSSIWAIEAVECAGDQGFWWTMHDHILQNQSKGVSTNLMKQYAKDLGLDTKAFNQCMDSDKYVSLAKELRAAGEKAGVRGTPSFVINGKPFTVQQSFDEVVRAVKEELKK